MIGRSGRRIVAGSGAAAIVACFGIAIGTGSVSAADFKNCGGVDGGAFITSVKVKGVSCSKGKKVASSAYSGNEPKGYSCKQNSRKYVTTCTKGSDVVKFNWTY